MALRNNIVEKLPSNLKEKIPAPEPEFKDDEKRIRVSFPYISPEAKESVMKAIENSTISSATCVVSELEDELCKYYDVPFAKACSNGYSALVLALKLAGIKANDEVLIPTFTMVAVLNAVLAVRGKPIFVDCEKDGYNPSVVQYDGKLTPKCRALIATHTYGVPADCRALRSFCNEKNLIFIEDIAEAIGTDYGGTLVGKFGDFACASLYANKTITSGDGGFVISTWKDANLKEKAESITNHGFTSKYHFLHFEASGNYKMSGLQAAFVLPAVKDIPKVMEDRNRISTLYREYLKDVPGIQLMPLNPYGKEAPWMFGVRVQTKAIRTTLRQKLADSGIETRDFFFPLHLQPLLHRPSNGKTPSLPVAEELAMTGFYLPTWYNMAEENIEEISQCLKNAISYM
jgi:perosamine synthetase